ncbi:MAG: sugar phosphate isomerase/epimerase [Verrucomicrobiae bacterium]|nr:sugar phosphate isomerase/epimerase [Verrucomicrobiae bacterium]
MNRREFLGVAGALMAGVGSGCADGAAGGGWKIGCYTRPWVKVDYRVALDGIAAAGYRHAGLMLTKGGPKPALLVSVDTPVDEAAKIGGEAKARGLSVVSIYGGDFRAAQSVEAGVAGLRHLIDNCVACGCPSLLLGGNGKPELQEAYYKVVAECCAYAKEKRVELVLKPHGGLNATGPQVGEIVRRVNHPSFRVWYDPGNILYYSDGQRDPAQDADAVAGLVTGMCVKDYAHPKNVALTPGDGQVDFAAVLAKLRQGGMSGGPLVVECLNPVEGEAIVAEARRARDFLEGLVLR